MSDIVLSVDGKDYTGWTSLDLTVSMETLSGSFVVSVTDAVNGGASKPIKKSPLIIPGQTCSVSLNGSLVITGYVDKVTPLIGANSHSIVIQGRDKTGDLVDCSMIQPISQWKGLTIDKIIKAICSPFGIPITANADIGQAFQNFVVEQGATCFEVIQKLCYMRQLLAISDGQGGLSLTIAGSNKSSTALEQGINIKAGQAEYDYSQRYSTYICKGQKQGTDLTEPIDNTANSGIFIDSGVSRYRPLMIIADGQATIADCTQRAKWQGSINRGKSRKLTITLNGWSQKPNGKLWGINTIVPIKSDLLGVDDELLVSQCNFKLDENGEITVLTLTDAEAYTLNTTSLLKSSNAIKSNPFIQG